LPARGRLLALERRLSIMTINQPNGTLSTSTNNPGAWPRYLNAAVGAWLFISAFLWPHSSAELTNAWVVGALVFIAALLALGAPTVRYANTVLALWLFISTLALGGSTGTMWNHVIVAIVTFVVSLVPNPMSTHGRPTIQRTV
jgi:hypothetical protein